MLYSKGLYIGYLGSYIGIVATFIHTYGFLKDFYAYMHLMAGTYALSRTY